MRRCSRCVSRGHNDNVTAENSSGKVTGHRVGKHTTPMPISPKLTCKIIVRSPCLALEKAVGFHAYFSIAVGHHKKRARNNRHGGQKGSLFGCPHANHCQWNHGCNNTVWKEERQPRGKVNACQTRENLKYPRSKCRQ